MAITLVVGTKETGHTTNVKVEESVKTLMETDLKANSWVTLAMVMARKSMLQTALASWECGRITCLKRASSFFLMEPFLRVIGKMTCFQELVISTFPTAIRTKESGRTASLIDTECDRIVTVASTQVNGRWVFVTATGRWSMPMVTSTKEPGCRICVKASEPSLSSEVMFTRVSGSRICSMVVVDSPTTKAPFSKGSGSAVNSSRVESIRIRRQVSRVRLMIIG